MSAVNGISSAIDGVSTGRKWDINYVEPQTPVIASNTDGGEYILAGNSDWDGSFDYYLTPTTMTPPYAPGAAISFVGSVDGSVGCSGTAIIDKITINWDIEGAKAITATATFKGNGPLTRGAAVATDATDPDVFTSIGTHLDLSPAGDDTGVYEVLDVRTMTIEMMNDVQSYVSSSTNAQVRRLKGNFKATCGFTLYPTELEDLPQVGDVYSARFYTDVANDSYYQLDFININAVNGITVDRETASIVGATVAANYSGWAKIAGTVEQGKLSAIIDGAAGVDIWPE